MNQSRERFEEILIKALTLKEAGRLESEILDLFPDFQEELKEIFGVIKILVETKETVTPSGEIFPRLLEQISAGVTREEKNRYLFMKGEMKRGRFSPITLIKSQVTMVKNWKVVIPLGVLALAVLVVVTAQFVVKSPRLVSQLSSRQAPTATGPSATPSVQSPGATASIDDVVGAFFADSSAEATQVSKVIDDYVALVGFDSQAISDFGQSYNENDF